MPDDLVQFWKAWINALRNTQPHLLAYLVYMSVRLLEMRRILKPTGSIYLHCDPVASHYIKVIMDGIFGHSNFRNEITWKRTNAKGQAFTRYASNHDVILYYTKSDTWTWNPQYTPHDPEYVEKFYKYVEPETGRRFRHGDLTNPNKNRPNLEYEFLGITRVWRWTKERMQRAYEDGLVIQTKPGNVPVFKRYLDEQEGNPIDDVWTDIRPLQAHATERLGYPTQKPMALLERIIQSSSNPGDVVFDPFAGCGTAVYAAHTLERRWIGCDVAILSVQLMRDALKKRYGLRE
jgi:site-specific DNA-methyltransferase (adenine-specific)